MVNLTFLLLLLSFYCNVTNDTPQFQPEKWDLRGVFIFPRSGYQWLFVHITLNVGG